ncbi:hypothetical protein A4X13_0g2474 [Tilletia indica]|uniref:Uncharacterized protein n=1 Tax=Tilletia indica TaxID=43049 RepID=A0A8T8T7C9_9BASI|nr:hypothetical protein A4X13_0g2474 [Tilletia indica]
MKLVNLFILVALSSSLFTTCQAVECSECTDNACNILCVTCQGNGDDGYLPRTISNINFQLPNCNAVCKRQNLHGQHFSNCVKACSDAQNICCDSGLGCCGINNVKNLCRCKPGHPVPFAC